MCYFIYLFPSICIYIYILYIIYIMYKNYSYIRKIEIEKTGITIRLLMDDFVYKFLFTFYLNGGFFSSIRYITVMRGTAFEKIIHDAYFFTKLF